MLCIKYREKERYKIVNLRDNSSKDFDLVSFISIKTNIILVKMNR